MKQVLAFFLTAFLFVSCGQTHYQDVCYKGSGLKIYVFESDGETPFNGKVWADDKSSVMEVDCGVIRKVTFFYTSGEICSTREKGEDRVFYNKKGNVITRDEFRDLYNSDFRTWKEAMRRTNAIVIENTLP